MRATSIVRITDDDYRDKSSSPCTERYFQTRLDEDEKEMFTDQCRYWSWNCLINGVFTTSRTIGYTQFMVFMILRVIILGSLCGRLFGNDPYGMNCSSTETRKGDTRRATPGGDMQASPTPANDSAINTSSYEVMMTCMNSAYSGVSPITIWGLSTLTAFIPPLVLLPWTPATDEQEYVVCKPTRIRWPCLTTYVVHLMKVNLRCILELTCVVTIPVLYGWRIPSSLTCYGGSVKCDLLDKASEKTCFLWFLAAVNLASCVLTVIEIADMCRNKYVYESEHRRYNPATTFSTRSSKTRQANVTCTHESNSSPGLVKSSRQWSWTQSTTNGIPRDQRSPREEITNSQAEHTVSANATPPVPRSPTDSTQTNVGRTQGDSCYGISKSNIEQIQT